MNIKCPDGYIIGGQKYKECPYPYYGVAPHIHDIERTGLIFGSTVIKPKEQWPDNFKQDPDSEQCGMYLCPYNQVCKEREKEND